jgi:tetratricopeptide (TPR) repeat protein
MNSSTTIPIPSEGKDFERKCVPLFAGLLGDPNAKVVGTSGQGQKGLDILARRNRDPRQPVGVQCKLRTRGDKLTEKLIREEVDAALAVVPPLTEYYIVTTAPDDTAYDLLAVQLSQEQAALGRVIDIQIWGWDTLQQRIHADATALRAFDPGHSAATDEIIRVGVETAEQVTAIRDQGAGTAIRVQEIHAILTSGDTSRGAAVDAHLDAEVDRYRDLINSGKARTALDLLESLKGRLTATDSAKIRARVTANIGWAKLQLGEDSEGARLLLDAYAINPDDPKTIANRVFGLIMSGNVTDAVAFAKNALLEDPTNAGVAAFVFQAAAKADEDFDPFDIVPAALLEDENVRLHHLNYARFKLDKAEWRRLARETYQALPSSDTAEQCAAEALLDEAFEERAFELHPVPPRAPGSLLREAVRLLDLQWQRVRGFETVGQPVSTAIAVNLANGLRALDEREQAATVIEEAVRVAPEHRDARLTAAYVALEANRPQVALGHLTAIEELGSKTVLLLVTWSRLERWADILAFATPERRAMVPDQDKITFDALLFRARTHNAPIEQIEPLVAELFALWPRSIAARVVAADALRRLDGRRAEVIAAQAMTFLDEETTYADRMMLSELMGELDDFEAVITVLDGHVDVTKPSRRLLRLTLAFTNAPIRPRTRAFFESLPSEVTALPKFARLIGVGEASRGDLGAAERHLRVAVDGDAGDVRAHIALESVLYRQGRDADGRDLVLATNEAALSGSPMHLMRWAYSLSRAGAVDRALALGYRTARENRADEEVAGAYPMLLYGADIPATTAAVEANSAGGANTWFDLEGQGCPDVDGVIEEGAATLDRYSFDHPLAQAIKGKAVGEIISLPREFGPDRVYKIRELKPKYVWLAHDIQKSHATRFPEATNLFEMSIEDGDISPILEIIKARADHGKLVEQSYTDNHVPLAAVAAANSVNVIELSDQLRYAGIGLRTCQGEVEEREAAVAAAKGARSKGAVVDLLTVWTLYRLELLEVARAFFGRLLLPRSAIDVMMELRAKSVFHSRSEFMTLRYEGDQAYRQVHSPADTAANVESITTALDAIQAHCEIKPTDGSDDLLLNFDNIDSADIAEVFDPITLARQQNMVLLSQDLRLRHWAQGLGVNSATWLQPVLAVAATAGLASRSQYACAVAQLSHLRHEVVWLNPEVLIGILSLDDRPAEALFDAALTQLFFDGADWESHSGVALAFLANVAGGDVEHARALRAMGKVLDRMIKGREAWRSILRSVELRLRGAARQSGAADAAWRYVRAWALGHCLGIDFDLPDPGPTSS